MPGDSLQPAADVHFLADVFDIGADGFRADFKLVANFLVNETRTRAGPALRVRAAKDSPIQ